MKKTDQDKLHQIMSIMRNNAKKDRILSMSRLKQTLNGKIILGKYIFLIRPSLLIKVPLDCVTTALKKFQGIIPVNRKTVNVFKSALKSDAKTTAITDIIMSGLMSDHR